MARFYSGHTRNPPAGFGICAALLVIGLLGGRAGAYDEMTVETPASIVGVVKFSGTVPPPQRYRVTMGANPEYCRAIADADGNIVAPQVRVSALQELADVVVLLQEVEQGKPVPKDGPRVTVEQCRFGPRVVTGTIGQLLGVSMKDTIVHQIRGWEMVGKSRIPSFFSSGLNPGAEQAFPLHIKRSSILQLSCDQHRFMEGWVLITANPYATITNEQGRFELTDIPPGTHTIGAWHPVLGYQEGTVTLTAGHQTTMTLTLTPPPVAK
ncbi:MAG TPA: hypothetical protein VLA99_06870 [Nitrospiraceae bacterium]|nr:hypothetical protein [Nitrospiraceae bacterium]